MKEAVRRLGPGLILVGILAASVSLSAAQTQGVPFDVVPGSHEEGLYVMDVYGNTCPGHVCIHLWRDRELTFPKDESDKMVTAESRADAPALVGGAGSRASIKDLAVAPGETPLGSYLAPTASGESHVARLENGVRGMIDRLHSR